MIAPFVVLTLFRNKRDNNSIDSEKNTNRDVIVDEELMVDWWFFNTPNRRGFCPAIDGYAWFSAVEENVLLDSNFSISATG